MQHERRKGRVADRNLVVDAENLRLAERAEVEVEAREFARIREFELQLLAQLPGERVAGILAGVNRAAEATPMIGVEVPRDRI